MSLKALRVGRLLKDVGYNCSLRLLHINVRRILSSGFKDNQFPSSNRFAELFNKGRMEENKPKRERNGPRNYRNSQPSRERFELEGFTPKAKSSLESVIEKVKSQSPNCMVQVIRNGKLKQVHLAQVINNLDPKTQGIQIVPNNENKILIKQVPLLDMLKNYSDELAKEMEQQLLQLGSRSVLRAMNQREKADKKKSGAKVVTLNWNISLSDLKNQKKAEINKRIRKGEKFLIYIDGSKISHQKATENLAKVKNVQDFNLESDNLDSIELKRRNLILDELDVIFEETGTKYDITGSIDNLLIFHCTPKEIIFEHSSAHNEKKQKRLERQRQNEQSKKQKKLDEADLDSLYLFKIED